MTASELSVYKIQIVKREKHRKYKPINIILYSWYKKCEAVGIYFTGPILKEGAVDIKTSLGNSELKTFKA